MENLLQHNPDLDFLLNDFDCQRNFIPNIVSEMFDLGVPCNDVISINNDVPLGFLNNVESPEEIKCKGFLPTTADEVTEFNEFFAEIENHETLRALNFDFDNDDPTMHFNKEGENRTLLDEIMEDTMNEESNCRQKTMTVETMSLAQLSLPAQYLASARGVKNQKSKKRTFDEMQTAMSVNPNPLSPVKKAKIDANNNDQNCIHQSTNSSMQNQPQILNPVQSTDNVGLDQQVVSKNNSNFSSVNSVGCNFTATSVDISTMLLSTKTNVGKENSIKPSSDVQEKQVKSRKRAGRPKKVQTETAPPKLRCLAPKLPENVPANWINIPGFGLVANFDRNLLFEPGFLRSQMPTVVNKVATIATQTSTVVKKRPKKAKKTTTMTKKAKKTTTMTKNSEKNANNSEENHNNGEKHVNNGDRNAGIAVTMHDGSRWLLERMID